MHAPIVPMRLIPGGWDTHIFLYIREVPEPSLPKVGVPPY